MVKSMKNVWKWLFIGLLVVIIAVGIILSILHSNFHEPGVNITANHALICLSEDCYFIDGGTVTGKSTLSMEGYLWDRIDDKADSFYGYVNLKEYPAATVDMVDNFSGGIDSRNYLWLTNQHIVLLRDDWEYYYKVYIYESDPDLIMVHVVFDDGRTLTAVCGDSEEDALKNYDMIMDIIWN